MADKIKSNIIAQHALENPKNLELIIDTVESFDFIRQQVIVHFLESLKTKLNIKSEFDCVLLKENITWSYEPLLLEITHETWENTAVIGIGNDNYGPRDVYLAVRQKRKTQKGFEAVIEKLKNDLSSGKTDKDNIWWEYVPKQYKDWRNREPLLSLLNGDALEYFSHKLNNLLDISDPLLRKIP